MIKRGWDWLGITPLDAERVHGLIEVPALAEALTLNKADFVKTGARGTLFVAYRKAIQEAVSAQLAAWGDDQEAEAPRQPRTRSLERDIERVLGTLARDFPLLTALVEKWRGGQRRLPLGTETDPDIADEVVLQTIHLEPEISAEAPAATDADQTPRRESDQPENVEPAPPATSVAVPGRKQRSTPAKLGIEIRFESRPDSEQLGRLIESTVWVNDVHPAYQRALNSRSEGYHIALTVALALASLVVEPHATHGFVTSFLTKWGESAANGRKSAKKT